MPDICAGHKQSHMGETVSTCQGCNMGFKRYVTCMTEHAVLMVVQTRCVQKTLGVRCGMCRRRLAVVACTRRRHCRPPISRHVIAMMWPSPTAIQPTHHHRLVPTTNGIPSPHPCFPVCTHAPYVHTNPHPLGFVLLHPPPPYLCAYFRPLLTPTIALSPPPMHPSPHHPLCPPLILALTSQDQLKNRSSTGLDQSGHVTSFNQLQLFA